MSKAGEDVGVVALAWGRYYHGVRLAQLEYQSLVVFF